MCEEPGALGQARLDVEVASAQAAAEGAGREQELAGARASRVVRILAERGVPPDRLSAVSFGEYVPRASNDTPKGRARNRRIEITLKPMKGAQVAAEVGDRASPAPAPAKAAP